MSDWHRWDGADLLLTLRVQPRASRDELLPADGRLRVRITAPPVDGAANAHLLRYLASRFGVAPSRTELVRGTSGREKTVRIRAPSVVPDELAGHLARTQRTKTS
jgi:uncharacterized protein (TIGR00251 family)